MVDKYKSDNNIGGHIDLDNLEPTQFDSEVTLANLPDNAKGGCVALICPITSSIYIILTILPRIILISFSLSVRNATSLPSPRQKNLQSPRKIMMLVPSRGDLQESW